jgi:hypothetical protein
MRSLHEAAGRELLWRPRSLLSRIYDLVDPDETEAEPYATLTLRGGFLSYPRARGESVDGCWLFRHRGFFREGVTVQVEGSQTPLATFRRYWRRGVVRFEDGREFVWRPVSFWGLAWRFEDPNGMPVVRFRTRFSFPRATTRMELDSSAGRPAGVALLACLGFYLLVLARRRHAAHGA